MEKNPNDFNQNFTKFILAVFLFVLGVWVGRNVAIPFLPDANQPKYNVLNKLYQKNDVDFSTFWEVWDTLNSTYLNKKDLSGQKLVQGAISGLVQSAGDPYTSYYDPEANKSFNNELSGIFEGVGIELGVKDSKLVVVAPLEDSPASKAGIKAGDKIVVIDGKDTSSFTIADAVKLIRGKAGTKVKLSILREGKNETMNFDLTRDKITIKTVKTETKDGIEIVSVSRFGDNTKAEWDEVVNKITVNGTKKLILDLRNDPGGRLDTAIYIAGEFLPEKSVVVIQEDSNGKQEKLTSDRTGRLIGIDLVVLINKGSASASEIVSGALQDYKKAKIVGETSFGKGVVQSVTDLKDGGGLHVTVAKWLTPNGNWIHGKGIKPDIEVVLSEDDAVNSRDPQMDKSKELLK